MKALRTCNKCGKEAHTEQELDLFVTHKHHPTGKQNKCKECDNKRRSEAKLQENYGITIEEYHKLLKEQDYKCAICDTQETDRNWRRFAVDHNHDTGEVRGLLCDKCNTGIGALKDSITVLKSAIAYLEERGSYDRTTN